MLVPTGRCRECSRLEPVTCRLMQIPTCICAKLLLCRHMFSSGYSWCGRETEGTNRAVNLAENAQPTSSLETVLCTDESAQEAKRVWFHRLKKGGFAKSVTHTPNFKSTPGLSNALVSTSLFYKYRGSIGTGEGYLGENPELWASLVNSSWLWSSRTNSPFFVCVYVYMCVLAMCISRNARLVRQAMRIPTETRRLVTKSGQVHGASGSIVAGGKRA